MTSPIEISMNTTQSIEPIPRTLRADAKVCAYIHYECGESRQTVQVKHRTRNARLQVSVNGKYRNVPRCGHFKFRDGTIGRVQIVDRIPLAPMTLGAMDRLRETLRNRCRAPYRR